MASLFAPPRFFASFAAEVSDDPDLVPGVHLRLLPAPMIGFPLCPFVMWRILTDRVDPEIHWTDARGALVGTPDLDAAGGELRGHVLAPPDPPQSSRMVAIEFIPTAGQPLAAALLDRVSGRVIAERSGEPVVVAAPAITHLRIRGQGPFDLIGHQVNEERLLGPLLQDKPVATLSLPIDGNRPWYAGGAGHDAAMARVKRGAPQRLGPPDQPDGPFDAISPADEFDRLAAMAAGINDDVETMLRDIDTPPWLQRAKAETLAAVRSPRQRTSASISGSLLLQGLDPGIGRYLGLATVLDEAPAAWATVGAFAIDPSRRTPDGRALGDVLGEAHPAEERILERLMSSFGGLDGLVNERRDAGLIVRALVTVAATPPLPNPPEQPALRSGAQQWLIGDQVPSDTFRQELLLSQTPLVTLASLARDHGAGWTSLHRPIGVRRGVDRRAALVFGRNRDGDGLLADALAPATPLTYRVRLGDLFGRYGDAGEMGVEPPPRPRPPRPALQTEILWAAPDHASANPASPGTLLVRAPVPGLAELGAGALPLLEFEATFNGHLETVAAAGGLAEVSFGLPALGPGETQQWTLSATLRDASGAASEPALEGVSATDARRPPPRKTGVGIIWTSRPGASEDVELKLTWPGRPGEHYRVYVADAAALGIPVADRTRAEIAEAASHLGAVDKREHFRLITDPPLASNGGPVVMSERLPRSLQTLQLLRVVPVSAGNVEAPFAACGLVPVAVPSDRRPPSPRLQVSVDAAGLPKVRIEAPGLNRAQILQSEPGLDATPPDPGARLPEFRLRRATSAVPEPIYAPEIARGPLVPADVDGFPSFAADDAVPGAAPLVPFVRYLFWAEVRVPAERRVPPDVDELNPPDAIRATEPAQIADMPGLFSAPSSPFPVMWAPAAPSALAAESVAASMGAHPADPAKRQLAIIVDDAPVAHQRAVAPYRLRIWLRQGGGVIQAIADAVPATAPHLEWRSEPLDPAGNGSPSVALVAVVDPLGRIGPLTSVDVEAV